VLRGIPDLLVIYLLYFGGSEALTALAHLLGAKGFVGVNSFAAGAIAVGIISGAYQGEIFRGAYHAIARGELEAARSVGMPRMLLFRRIIVPRRCASPSPGSATSGNWRSRNRRSSRSWG
jgi:octopine/nopaline transport system permease protein